MNAKNRQAMVAAFGEVRLVEDVRTEILFTFPYGDISVPSLDLDAGLQLLVARVPDEEFYTGCYWANYGPKPCDSDSNIFVIPCVTKPWMEVMLDNWARVLSGKFVTTESGIIILDVDSLFAWEGYERPGKRDYDFDRRRLEKSAAALKSFAGC